MTVTGPVATWNNSGTVNVGFAGGENSLSVLDGGVVTSVNGYLAAEAGSSGNTATVSGKDSSWTTSLNFFTGYLGGTNSLLVSGGGAVSTNIGGLGWNATSGNNSVLVTGAGSQWSNSDVLYIGNAGSANTFSVESGGTATSTHDTVVGYAVSSSGNVLRVKDAGSKFQVLDVYTLHIGDHGSNNSLEISNGGLVTGNNARLAYYADSANNSVTVTGPVSAWTNTGTIRVGTLGGGNAVTVSAGGAVSFAGNAFIGHGAAAPNNTVTVTGTGSTWTSGNTLTVGLASTGNVLTARDGGAVTAPGIVIAANAGSGGTVNIGAGGVAGTIASPISFGAGTGIVNFNHTDAALSFGGPITGPGAVRHIGSGTTVLTGANTYSGGTTLAAGTLQLGVDNALPASGQVVFAGGTLAANGRSVSMGALSLQSSSTLRLGSLGSSAVRLRGPASRPDVVFASAASWVGGTLTVTGWGGPDGTTYGRILVTSDPTASGILAHIQFSNHAVGAIWIAATGEVVPYVAAPTVTGLSPTGGPTDGGTSVIITGTNFTGATAVKFGSTNATSYTVNSAAQITAASPGGSGTVDVTVTTTGGTSATSSADQYTYVAAPTVTGLSPTGGPTAGGTSVIITGTNFTGATAVKFGSTNATSYTVNSAAQITAASPAGSGTVDVTVTTTGGTGTGTGLYTYTGVTTFSGPTATGTGIATASISGGGAACSFVDGAAFVDASSVSVAAPVQFPHGLFRFTLRGCTGPVTMKITYPSALPVGSPYWKYGPPSKGAAPTWYLFMAAPPAATATYTLTLQDNRLGDDDWDTTTDIVDQGGPGTPPEPGTPIPTLGGAGLALLACLLAVTGLLVVRRMGC